MTSRLRVLCLHGFTSNAAVHAHQVRRITKALPEYEFLFADGPHTVNIAEQSDLSKPANQAWTDLVNGLSKSGHRAWWFARDGNWNNKETGGFFGLEQSLEYIGNYIQERGPVHAIWGFSQGACFAGILCALLQDKLAAHPLRKHLPAELTAPMAGVIFSGFRARFAQYDGLYENGIDMPMLHVLGKQDALVRSERSEEFIRVCERADVLIHDGGHDIPKGESDQARIIEFLKTNVRHDDSQRSQTTALI